METNQVYQGKIFGVYDGIGLKAITNILGMKNRFGIPWINEPMSGSNRDFQVAVMASCFPTMMTMVDHSVERYPLDSIYDLMILHRDMVEGNAYSGFGDQVHPEGLQRLFQIALQAFFLPTYPYDDSQDDCMYEYTSRVETLLSRTRYPNNPNIRQKLGVKLQSELALRYKQIYPVNGQQTSLHDLVCGCLLVTPNEFEKIDQLGASVCKTVRMMTTYKGNVPLKLYEENRQRHNSGIELNDEILSETYSYAEFYESLKDDQKATLEYCKYIPNHPAASVSEETYPNLFETLISFEGETLISLDDAPSTTHEDEPSTAPEEET